jgi:hypothetical protein
MCVIEILIGQSVENGVHLSQTNVLEPVACSYVKFSTNLDHGKEELGEGKLTGR